MIASFPSLQELGVDEEILNVVRMLRDGIVSIVGIMLVVIFALLVLVCQFPRFKSFMWLGVDFILGGGLTLVVTVSFEAIFNVAMAGIPLGTDILSPMVEGFTGTMKAGALIELGLAVLFIVIFVVGRKVLRKKMMPQTV